MFYKTSEQRFGNWIYFLPPVSGETTTVFQFKIPDDGYKVQKPYNP
jgi:hypothetical protein